MFKVTNELLFKMAKEKKDRVNRKRTNRGLAAYLNAQEYEIHNLIDSVMEDNKRIKEAFEDYKTAVATF